MKLRIVLEVDLDEAAYATEYGIDPVEVRANVIEHIPDTVTEAAQTQAGLLGYFTVTHRGTAQVLGEGPGQVVIVR